MIGMNGLKTYEELKKMLMLFFKNWQKQDKELFELYLSKLQKYDHKKIIKRLDNMIELDTSAFLPKPGDILKAFENSEGEIAWIRFKQHCFERYAPMPNDVYTICKIIGRDKLDNCTKEEFSKWIKKEFMEIYKDYQSGMYEELEDPKKEIHKQLESGNWIKPKRSQATFKPDWSAIKAVLKK